jgi:hypothetical protein
MLGIVKILSVIEVILMLDSMKTQRKIDILERP